MSVPFGRRISVASTASGIGSSIHMDISSNRLSKETLQSQFSNAIGLKYMSDNQWVAVSMDHEFFVIPDATDSFVVVTNTLDKARSILNSNRLASQVSSVFGMAAKSNEPVMVASHSPSTVGSSMSFPHSNTRFRGGMSSCLQQPLSRKQTRSVVRKLSKAPKEKVFKVVFIESSSLPVNFTKEMIVVEGFVRIKENESEEEIMSNLRTILEQSNYTCSTIENLQILLYSSKTLSVPCSAYGFVWCLESVKLNVGQGKLYVMVNEKDSTSSPTASSEPRLPVTNSTDNQPLFDSTSSPTASPEPRFPVTNSTDNQPMFDPTSSPTASSESRQPVTNSTDNQPMFDPTSPTTPSEPRQPVTNSTGNQPMFVDSDTGTPTITFRRRLSRRSSTTVTPEREQHSLYRSYIGLLPSNPLLIGESDSSDEETDKAPNPPESRTLTELLVTLRSKIEMDKSSKFNICRSDILDGARRAIHRKSFQPHYRMSVKFTDDIGLAEGAVDAGGPKRELLRLLVRKVQELPIFEGSVNRRSLAFRQSDLQDNLYEDVGVLLAMSIVHGGPCPKFMAEWLYDAIVSGLQSVTPTIEMVGDSELQTDINQLSSATSLSDVLEKINTMSTMITLAGCFRPVRNLLERDSLVCDLIRFVVMDRIYLPIEQLKQGLRCLGVLEAMTTYKETMKEMFLFNEDEKLTGEKMEAVYVDIHFSQTGSNRRVTEERVVGYWRDFLMDVEEKSDVEELKLSDILVFGTGADVVPPLGFEPSPTIEFLHKEENESNHYPKANTCAMILSLPMEDSYEIFKRNMIFGIKNSQGFGFA